MTDASNHRGFEVEVDRRCQRGLHLRYSLQRVLEIGRLCERLTLASPVPLVRGDEAWGAVSVVRIVRPYRFEIRLQPGSARASLIHRHSANESERLEDRAWFETVLAEATDA